MATGVGGIEVAEVAEGGAGNADGNAASVVAQGPNEHPMRASQEGWRLAKLLALTTVVFAALFIVFAALYADAIAGGTPSPAPPAPAPPPPPPGTMDLSTIEKVRSFLLAFVNMLTSEQLGQIYYSDMSKMAEQWLMCPIVQQCQEPLFGLSTADISPEAYGMFIGAVSMALGDEGADKHLLLQLAMNDLLGQVQNWATECAGSCIQLDESYGHPAMLPKTDFLEPGILQYEVQHGMRYEECFAASLNMSLESDYTWFCTDMPVLLFGEMNTSTGRYRMNSVFKEPCMHPRTKGQNYVSVYGSLRPADTGPFGFRFTGHHFDVGLEFVNDGNGTVLGVSKYPQFVGHNPLNVMNSPPLNAAMREHEEEHDETEPGGALSLWNLFSGSVPFPFAASAVIDLARLLPSDAYAPLDRFISNSTIGGLSYVPPYTGIDDVSHITLRDSSAELFDAVLAFFGILLTDTSSLRDNFWATGKLTWTSENRFDLPNTIGRMTTSSRFMYVQVQTDSHYCFGMVNLMFTYVALESPSNHLHVFCSPVSFLSNPQHFRKQADPNCTGHHS